MTHPTSKYIPIIILLILFGVGATLIGCDEASQPPADELNVPEQSLPTEEPASALSRASEALTEGAKKVYEGAKDYIPSSEAVLGNEADTKSEFDRVFENDN